MSRPEEPPRSASPLKRRAGSAAPDDDNPTVSEDVDMTTASAANDEAPTVDHVEDSVQEEDINSPGDAASTTAQVDGIDEDIPDLLGLDMDRRSIEVAHAGSEMEDILMPENTGDKDATEQDTEQDKDQGQSPSDGKAQTQNDSSTSNSDEAADWDSKTVDTAATGNSVEPSAKNSALSGTALESGINGKTKANRSGRNSPAPTGPATRGRNAKSDRTLGLTGLTNLGNTCYMNSALQCIRSVEELTKYFLVDEYANEVNYDNPLGHGGNVARAYAFLLHQIYKIPPPTSVTPRGFKDTVGRHAPQFSGWGQQDTQEFLGFLLDGLQEDMNRVKKKPYIEKPDSTDDMVNNPDAIRELAVKVWEIHKARDDSVISDLFTGLYKSTLECPTCDKISITFDPFDNLTLPLPVQNMWVRSVKLLPLNDRPVKMVVEIDKTASIRTLKEFISSRIGILAERLVGAEEYKDKFFKIYSDDQVASEEIAKDDMPVFFEVEASPTNLPLKKRRKGYSSGYTLNHDDDIPSPEDPLAEQMAEKMLVPVFHRLNPRLEKDSRILSRSSENISPPHFIILTPDEARDEDIIRRKVLEKVATFSTWSLVTSVPEYVPTENPDQDPSLVSVNVSDADSSGVTAQSVEGEDDIVDVSMQDVPQNQAPQNEPGHPAAILKRLNSQRPEWIDPAVFLDGQLQQLFDISYLSERSLIPTGWTSLASSPEKLFPRLDARKPRPATPSDEDMPSPSGSGTASEESSTEETSGIATSVVEGSTRMVDESSEDDSVPSNSAQDLPHRTTSGPLRLRGGKKKMKAYNTYSKKGRKRFNKEQKSRQVFRQHNIFDEDPEWGSKADGGPLVRLGEGLVVDWNPKAWEVVFGQEYGNSDNKVAGRPTFLDGQLETLKDAQLEAKIQARKTRHNKGISLDDCLDQFEKEEILSENDKWYCPRCKEHCRAKKKFELWHTPDILIVHLKRFSSSGSRRDKLDVAVDFPIEGLDISTRVLEKKEGQQEVYDLIAIDDHMGGLGGGHYTAFAKNFVDNAWYKFDDSMVSPVRDTQRMITSHAYLLFYRRRSDRPLGGPKLEAIVRRWAGDEEDANDDAVDHSESAESR